MSATSTAATTRPRIVAAEITKLLSLRSILIASIVTVVLPILAAWSQAGVIAEALRTTDSDLAPGTIPETVGFEWVPLGLIGIFTISVVAASSEYVSGQIATSLVAAPGRTRLFVTKTAALLILITAVGVVSIPTLSLLSQVGLGELSLIDPSVPLSLVLRWMGAIFFWDAMALIAFAFAFLLRQTLIPLFVLIVISQLSLLLLLLTPWFAWLPTIAGIQLFDAGLITGSYPAAALDASLAVGVTAGWTTCLLTFAWLHFIRRDA